MTLFVDARVPVLFGALTDLGPHDAALIEGEGAATPGRGYFVPGDAPSHPAGCTCCPARGPAGIALSALLFARARGQGPYFRRVVAVVHSRNGAAAVARAINSDPLASSCFTLATCQPDGLSPHAGDG